MVLCFFVRIFIKKDKKQFKIKEKGLQTKVVFVSGYADFEYARCALQLGPLDYFLKPVEQETAVTDEEEPENASDTVLKQMVNEIREHYTENITLKMLSEKYGFSTGYISSLLKIELGLPFSEYITEKRIQKAKELLADSKLSIDMIAEKTGYNDYFYFTKVFIRRLSALSGTVSCFIF